MDAIETIDWGAYAHFTFVATKYPDTVRFIQAHYDISTYVVLVGLIASVLLLFVLFVLQKRIRAAVVTSMGFIVSMGIIEICRLLVPRRRPPDAQELVGAHDMLGSYPSAGVFVFLLMMIYFGFALWPWLRTGVMRGIFVVVAIVLTASVALSQFFLAIHFVSDVVGGIVGATIVGFIVSKFLNSAKSSLTSTIGYRSPPLSPCTQGERGERLPQLNSVPTLLHPLAVSRGWNPVTRELRQKREF